MSNLALPRAETAEKNPTAQAPTRYTVHGPSRGGASAHDPQAACHHTATRHTTLPVVAASAKPAAAAAAAASAAAAAADVGQ